MTGALALLMGAVLVCAQGPRALSPISRHESIDPQIGMVAWLASLLGVVITAVAGVVVLGLPGHGGLGQMLGRLNSC